MTKAKRKAYTVGFVLIILLYILPEVLSLYWGRDFPSGFDGGVRGLFIAASVSSLVYLLSPPEDG